MLLLTNKYELWWDNSSDWFVFSAYNGNTTVGLVTANNHGAPAVSTWYHIICWHGSANNQTGISVNNGTPNTANTSNVPSDSTAAFMIGADGSGTSGHGDGRIDAMGFWKRVLTSAERSELYNNGAGKEYPFT